MDWSGSTSGDALLYQVLCRYHTCSLNQFNMTPTEHVWSFEPDRLRVFVLMVKERNNSHLRAQEYFKFLLHWPFI